MWVFIYGGKDINGTLMSMIFMTNYFMLSKKNSNVIKAKYILSVFIALIATTLLYLITTALHRQSEQVTMEDSLPNAALTTVDGSQLSLAEALPGKRALLSFINPGCDHCRYEVEALCSDAERPSDIQIVFLSGAPSYSLRALAEPRLEVHTGQADLPGPAL